MRHRQVFNLGRGEVNPILNSAANSKVENVHFISMLSLPLESAAFSSLAIRVVSPKH